MTLTRVISVVATSQALPAQEQDALVVPGLAASAFFVFSFGCCLFALWALRLRRELDRKELQLRMARTAAGAAVSQLEDAIRTPMTSILGMTERALKLPMTVDQRDCLETVRKSARSVAAVLNVPAPAASAPPPEPFEPRRLLVQVREQARGDARSAGLAVTSYCSPQVPHTLAGSSSNLERILRHIVERSLRNTDRGGLHLEIDGEPACWPESGFVLRFTVSDTSSRGGEPLQGMDSSIQLIENMGGYIVGQRVAQVGATVSFSVKAAEVPSSVAYFTAV